MTTDEHWASRLPALFRPVYICPISMAPSRPTTSISWSLRSAKVEKKHHILSRQNFDCGHPDQQELSEDQPTIKDVENRTGKNDDS